MSFLIYCATPSRISEKRKSIMDFVSSQGHGPFHPFQAFEYERFEGGVVGREKTMEFCRRAVDICDEFWMFGVSRGTLEEAVYALHKAKKIRFFLDEFDPEWREYYSDLGPSYGNPLDEILFPNLP